MAKPLSNSAQKVQDALARCGLTNQVVEHEQTTRTAKEAAEAIGCTVGQIAKSLVFRGRESGAPILVIASGPNRVNEAGLARLAGEPVEKPDAAFVLAETGFVIGGVPPVGHAKPIRTYIDQDLLAYPQIWAAAGTPNAVFPLTPEELLRLTGAAVIQVT